MIPAVIAPELVAEMRAWLCECSWSDIEADEIQELSDRAIVRAVMRHYDGGVAAFLEAVQP